ncbi:hypothetical protein [Pararhizobium sp. O133]|uniref:hypothetical protein n=1 Tax=Pararhizobium sp. O133 TaxID=3449278 RepID=UPI003F687D9C
MQDLRGVTCATSVILLRAREKRMHILVAVTFFRERALAGSSTSSMIFQSSLIAFRSSNLVVSQQYDMMSCGK